VWVWNRAVAWHSQRGRKPGKMEQRLCRPTGPGFGKPAVLILDHGMVKPSMIRVFRVLCFWLSLELYLSQAGLQLLCRISGSAHEVCGSVFIAILDPIPLDSFGRFSFSQQGLSSSFYHGDTVLCCFSSKGFKLLHSTIAILHHGQEIRVFSRIYGMSHNEPVNLIGIKSHAHGVL
jgi:hypothetical protein